MCKLHNMHIIYYWNYFHQVGWTKRTGQCSMSTGKRSKFCMWYQFHPFLENSLLSQWGKLVPFPFTCETSSTKLMGLPVIQCRARVRMKTVVCQSLGLLVNENVALKIANIEHELKLRTNYAQITLLRKLWKLCKITHKLRTNYATYA